MTRHMLRRPTMAQAAVLPGALLFTAGVCAAQGPPYPRCAWAIAPNVIMHAHNAVRAAVDPPAQTRLKHVNYSKALENDAVPVAKKCERKPSITKNGENLFASEFANPGIALLDALYAWAGEGKAYDIATNQCVNSPSAPAGTCDQYKQMVLDGMTHVGCSIESCTKNNPLKNHIPTDPWTLVVCHYDQKGGVRRPYTHNIGEKLPEQAERSAVPPPISWDDWFHLNFQAHYVVRLCAEPPAKNPEPLRGLGTSSILQNLANRSALRCVYAHENESGLGENLAAASATLGVQRTKDRQGRTQEVETADPVQPGIAILGALSGWAKERKLYDIQNNHCNGKPRPPQNDPCGHYTQMVSAKVRSVACAQRLCEKNNPFTSTDPTTGRPVKRPDNEPWTFTVCKYRDLQGKGPPYELK